MSIQVLQQLEEKIDQALETIELLRIEVEDGEQKNRSLQAENTALKNKQTQFENNLSALLNKLEGVNFSDNTNSDSRVIKEYETEEESLATS